MKKKPFKAKLEVANCLKCGKVCEVVTGRQIYTHARVNADWLDAKYWKCPSCKDSYVGCHPGTEYPLGHAADKETRAMRHRLHKEVLDPLWNTRSHRDADNRKAVYRFLGILMDIEDPHVGEFTIEQCQEAWSILATETMASILKFIERVRKESNLASDLEDVDPFL